MTGLPDFCLLDFQGGTSKEELPSSELLKNDEWRMLHSMRHFLSISISLLKVKRLYSG